MRRRELMQKGITFDPITGRAVINGYEVVDLGLPSGLLWATCNVGASKETDYGNYYQWGAGSTTYANTNQYYTGSDDPLPSSADTATQVMGSGWRMPTLAEFNEFIYNSDIVYQWTTINGVNGYKFYFVENPSRYVFFPVAGYYNSGSLVYEGSRGYIWCASPSSNRSQANYLYFDEDNHRRTQSGGRGNGFPVRGVISLGGA